MELPPIDADLKQEATKKRKAPEPDELERLRAQCFARCATAQEYQAVAKMKSKTKMDEFMADKRFQAQQNVQHNVSSSVIALVSQALDAVMGGDGYVAAEMGNDLSLKEAVGKELVDVVSYLTNKVQIVLFSLSDVLHAKKKQRADAIAHAVDSGVGDVEVAGQSVERLEEPEPWRADDVSVRAEEVEAAPVCGADAGPE
jgi:hypothetical protein